MQISDREFQNTLDLLKKKQWMDEGASPDRAAEEVEQVADVVKQIEEIPEVRKEKVEKLRKALESESYNVTGDEVAKKLIGRIFSDKFH